MVFSSSQLRYLDLVDIRNCNLDLDCVLESRLHHVYLHLLLPTFDTFDEFEERLIIG